MKITILGAGAYGLALSKVLVKNKNEISLWTAFKNEQEELINTKKSSKLKGYVLDDEIIITTDLEKSIKNSNLIVIAIPTAFIADVCKELKKYINKNQYICIASKGIEQNTCLFIHDIVKKQIKIDNIGVISGPSFAVDLISDAPIGLTVAAKSNKTIKIIKKAFCNDRLNLYSTNDIIGVEICGAIKNVIAIAAGMLDGMGYPVSTRSLLITKSLNDVKVLIKSLGGKEKTILTLAGFGDIILTCTSEKSRNYSFGELLGSNSSKEIVDNYKNTVTVEGIYTLKSIYNLIKKNKINVPIVDILYNIVFNNCEISKLAEYLII